VISGHGDHHLNPYLLEADRRASSDEFGGEIIACESLNG
jgi:hypothetical protein